MHTSQQPRSADVTQSGASECLTSYRHDRLRLVRLAVLLVDDLETAEDVVQDAYAGLLARRSPPDDEGAYMRQSVVNGSRSVLRRRRTARAWIPPRAADEAPADSAVLLADEHREVIAALSGLPRRQREVLVLRFYEGMSESGIASVLGISKGTVKSSASRGLASLARAIGASK